METVKATTSLAGWQSVESAAYYSLSPNPEVVVLGGLGDDSQAMEATVSYLESEKLHAAGVIIEYPGSSTEAILATLSTALPSVIHAINGSAGLEESTPRHIVGVSLGGGEALLSVQLALATNPQIYGNIALINSIGIANQFFKPRPIRTFNDRRRLKSIAADWQPQATNQNHEVARLRYFLETDDFPQFIEQVLSSGYKLYICLANNDVMFRPEEIEQVLSEVKHQNLAVVRIPGNGGHASLTSELGRRQVAFAVRLVENGAIDHRDN